MSPNRQKRVAFHRRYLLQEGRVMILRAETQEQGGSVSQLNTALGRSTQAPLRSGSRPQCSLGRQGKEGSVGGFRISPSPALRFSSALGNEAPGEHAHRAGVPLAGWAEIWKCYPLCTFILETLWSLHVNREGCKSSLFYFFKVCR